MLSSRGVPPNRCKEFLTTVKSFLTAARMFLKCSFKIIMEFKMVVLRSFFLSFKFKIAFSFLDPKYFYEMAICCIIVVTGYNNAVLYKSNTFISNLEVNWRKELKPLTVAAVHIFF